MAKWSSARTEGKRGHCAKTQDEKIEEQEALLKDGKPNEGSESARSSDARRLSILGAVLLAYPWMERTRREGDLQQARRMGRQTGNDRMRSLPGLSTRKIETMGSASNARSPNA